MLITIKFEHACYWVKISKITPIKNQTGVRAPGAPALDPPLETTYSTPRSFFCNKRENKHFISGAYSATNAKTSTLFQELILQKTRNQALYFRSLFCKQTQKQIECFFRVCFRISYSASNMLFQIQKPRLTSRLFYFINNISLHLIGFAAFSIWSERPRTFADWTISLTSFSIVQSANVRGRTQHKTQL